VASGLKETGGPTVLNVSDVGNGQYLKRVGDELVGDTPAGSGDMTEAEYDADGDGTVNSASGLKETGDPQVLAMGAVADGQFFKRVGNEIVGATPAGAGDMEQDTYDPNHDGVVKDSDKVAGVTPTAAGLALLDDADASAQRSTLGLGDAATKNVGAAAGNVAAGDHNHDSAYSPIGHNHAGTYEPTDATILKSADIGVSVAAENHDHAGVYEPADATILKDADIGVNVAAENHNHDSSYIDIADQPTGAIVGTTDTQTLTNKRVNSRVSSISSSATPTPNCDTTDLYIISALAEAAAFGAPTGTPADGQPLLIRIRDNGTARALTWNPIYAPLGIALPTTTVISKALLLGFQYDDAVSKWYLVALAQEA